MIATYVDAETAVAAWAKANANITAAVKALSGRPSIFVGGVPKISNDPDNKKILGALPMLVLYRAGGSPEYPIDVPIDSARISFSCYGPNRPAAFNLANTLIQEAMSIVGGTVMGTSAVCGSASVLSNVWLPDPALDLPAFRVDILFTLVAKP